MRSVISVLDAALLTLSSSPLTLGDGEGEGTHSVISVVDAASSTSEVPDIIAIDGSLGGRASPCFPPLETTMPPSPTGGRGRGIYLLLLVFWLLCGICFR